MIYIDCRLVERKETGISRFSLEIANRIVEHFGYSKVNIIVREKHPSILGNQVICNLSPFNLIDFFRFRHWLSNKKATVYCSMHYSGLISKLAKCEQICTVHDLMYQFIPGFFGSRLKDIIGRAYFNFIVKNTLKSSDVVMSVSNTTSHDIKRVYGIDSTICGEGLGLKKSIPDFEDISERVKHSICNPYLLYVGNTRPHKGIRELITAFEKYRANGGELSLLLCGGVIDYSTDGVVQLGHVSDKELNFLYANAKKFVFPSRYEGFGLPILEAISFDLRIAANDIPAFREFNSSNIDFFDLSNEESIISAITKQSNFDKADAKRLLELYSWGSSATKYIKVIESRERK